VTQRKGGKKRTKKPEAETAGPQWGKRIFQQQKRKGRKKIHKKDLTMTTLSTKGKEGKALSSEKGGGDEKRSKAAEKMPN